MKARIWTKDREGRREDLVYGEFSEAEWERLKRDFLSHVETGTPSGGAYSYVDLSTGASPDARELLLRFSDVAVLA